MFVKKHSITLATLILSTALGLGAMSAQAASCKGAAKSACEGKGDCSWVKGYKRKDGAKVAAHCKSKPKKSGSSSSSGKKTDKKKKSDSKQ